MVSRAALLATSGSVCLDVRFDILTRQLSSNGKCSNTSRKISDERVYDNYVGPLWNVYQGIIQQRILLIATFSKLAVLNKCVKFWSTVFSDSVNWSSSSPVILLVNKSSKMNTTQVFLSSSLQFSFTEWITRKRRSLNQNAAIEGKRCTWSSVGGGCWHMHLHRVPPGCVCVWVSVWVDGWMGVWGRVCGCGCWWVWVWVRVGEMCYQWWRL